MEMKGEVDKVADSGKCMERHGYCCGPAILSRKSYEDEDEVNQGESEVCVNSSFPDFGLHWAQLIFLPVKRKGKRSGYNSRVLGDQI